MVMLFLLCPPAA